MKPSEILEKAKAKIEPEGAWTKHALAKDKGGNGLDPTELSTAVCWCSIGAIYAVDPVPYAREVDGEVYVSLSSEASKALRYVEQRVPRLDVCGESMSQGVDEFNDKSTTGKQDVLALFDSAIAYAKEEENANVRTADQG